MEKKEAVEALTRSAKIEGEWRYNVQRVLEKLLKWTERADVAPKLPAGLYAAGGDAFSKRREAEDWLGTLASLLGAVRTHIEEAELMPRLVKGGGGEVLRRAAAQWRTE